MSSVNDAIAESIRKHAVSVLRFEAGERKKILKMIDRLYGDLALQLQDSAIGGTSFQRRRLELMFRDAERLIAKAYKEIADSHAESMRGLESAEMEWITKTLNRSVSSSTLFIAPPLTDAQVAAAASEALIEGAPSREWWSRQSVKALDAFKDQMRLGWLQGETNDQLLRRLTGGKDVDGNPIFDLRRGSRRGAEATVRTSVQAVANDARMRVFRENEDVIAGVAWLATLDNRTTAECASLDGLMWDLEGNPIGHDKILIPPPRHWNCRSVLTPVTKSFKELGIDRNEIPPSTRASMDGQVPEGIGFDGWLRKKEREQPGFVADMFGQRKAQLWNAGKISVRDMTDQYGRELTLDQLRVHRDAWLGNYTQTELSKLKGHDQYFKGRGVIMNEHGLTSLEERLQSGLIPSREAVMDAVKNGTRYLDSRGNEARYLDGISVHFGKDGVLLAAIRRKEKDVERWTRLK